MRSDPSTSPSTPSAVTNVDLFASESSLQVEELRVQVSRLIGALPERAERAADLARALRLDAALAWQLHSLITQSDSLLASRLIPKPGAMARFIRSAKTAGLPQPLCDGVSEAYKSFEHLIDAHAGTRDEFDAMVSALRPDDAASLQKIRRAAYRADAAVWGVSARGTTHAVIFNERPSGEHDCLAIRGRIGLRKLYEHAVVSIYASGKTWGGGSGPVQPPLEHGPSVNRCELLKEHCTGHVPEVTSTMLPDGSVREFLMLQGIGRTAESTVFWRNMAMDFHGGSRVPPHGLSAPCLEPTELMVVDLLIPSGWANPKSATAWITPESSRYDTADPTQAIYRLPFEGEVRSLGTRLSRMHISLVPEYPDMIAQQIRAVGWQETVFDIVRCEIRYPALHSSLHVAVTDPA